MPANSSDQQWNYGNGYTYTMAKAIEAVRRFNGFLFYLYQGNYVSYYTDEEKEGPFTKERTMVDIPLVIQFKKPVRRHRIKAFLYEKRHPS